MYLKYLSIENLYYKNYNINFNQDLTILHGLNGSGKTTILDIIYSLLSGNINNILTYSFDKIEAILKSEKNEKMFSIVNLDESYVCTYGKIKAVISKNTEHVTVKKIYKKRYLEDNNYSEYEEPIERYFETISEDRNSLRLVESIKNDADIIYIPLNREVKGIKEQYNIGEEDRRNKVRKMSNSSSLKIDNSLKIAEMYFKSFQREILIKQFNMQEDMQRTIVSKLAEPIEDFNINNVLKVPDISDIKKDFMSYVTESSKMKKSIRTSINKLFDIFNNNKDSISSTNGKHEIKDIKKFMIYNFAYAQISKLKEVIESIAPIKKSIEEQLAISNKTLEVINSLLKDTNKKIIFSPTEGLAFQSKYSENLNISFLSSGEKQLLIFFIFSLIKIQSNKDNKILLVDEPELSLHIDWQSKLLKSVLSHNNESQIIIATHSPDIIGDYTDKCEEVRGIYK